MFLDSMNQYCQNDYITQSNLQIQCNPDQIINGIFHRTVTKKFLICNGNPKDPEEQQQSWERKMEPEESVSLASDYTTKLYNTYGQNTHQKHTLRNSALVADTSPGMMGEEQICTRASQPWGLQHRKL